MATPLFDTRTIPVENLSQNGMATMDNNKPLATTYFKYSTKRMFFIFERKGLN